MVQIDDEQFAEMVSSSIDEIPELYLAHLDNVAFLVEDDPSPEQRRQLGLHCNQTLFGLYEGIPLPARGGGTRILPDKITIFKNPILAASTTLDQAKDQIARTIWHEVAHYYGLDHTRIHELENKGK